jgi:hypothetical protein
VSSGRGAGAWRRGRGLHGYDTSTATGLEAAAKPSHGSPVWRRNHDWKVERAVRRLAPCPCRSLTRRLLAQRAARLCSRTGSTISRVGPLTPRGLARVACPARTCAFSHGRAPSVVTALTEVYIANELYTDDLCTKALSFARRRALCWQASIHSSSKQMLR